MTRHKGQRAYLDLERVATFAVIAARAAMVAAGAVVTVAVGHSPLILRYLFDESATATLPGRREARS